VAGGIEHRLTQPNHPWSQEDRKTIRWIVLPTGGQVERMNRTIRDATVKRFHDDSQGDLPAHLGDLLAAYTFARRLGTRASHGSRPGGELRPALTPHEYTCKISTAESDPPDPPDAGTEQIGYFGPVAFEERAMLPSPGVRETGSRPRTWSRRSSGTVDGEDVS
jgi:hypothetical protein